MSAGYSVSPAKESDRDGVRVDFDVRSVEVKVKGERKTILKNVSGAACSGELMAIMGPSGAGKSTLLDVIAGVQSGKMSVDKTVKLNGAPANKKTLSQTVYVRQTDVLVSSATVREAITTSAFLKLPRSMANRDRKARVDSIITELGLEECQNTLIGDEAMGMKGISGGQMRRTTIGIELVKNPTAVFLDEPTTGLDSEFALGVMQTLQTIARHGRTVVLTIHQPNSEIVETFDKLMLLAGGRLCYHGKYSDSMGFFSDSGHPCPMYKNPTDHYMRVLSSPDSYAAVADTFAKSEQQAENASKQEEGLAALSENGLSSSFKRASRRLMGGSSGSPVPMWFQFLVLIKRFFVSMWRHPVAFIGEVTQYWFMAVFVAVMYLQITDVLPAAAYDRTASQWFILVVLGFVPCFTATTMWISEAKVLKRETADRTYPVALFYVAKVLSVVPFEIFFALTSSLIMYFAIGYRDGFVPFMVFFAAMIMVLLISQSYGLAAGAITGDANGALIVVSLVLIILLSFTGFLTSQVPVYFSWVKHVSFLNFASSIMWVNEMDGVTLYTQDGDPVQGSKLLDESEYQRFTNGLTIGQNFACLIANFVLLHVIALVAVSFQQCRKGSA